MTEQVLDSGTRQTNHILTPAQPAAIATADILYSPVQGGPPCAIGLIMNSCWLCVLGGVCAAKATPLGRRTGRLASCQLGCNC